MPWLDPPRRVCDLWRREVVMRKVKAEEAPALLREWEASGERMSDWCARRGLSWYSLSAFKGWGGRATEVPFAELVVAEVDANVLPCGEARYRIEIGSVTVEVGDDFRVETLQRLVRAVAAC